MKHLQRILIMLALGGLTLLLLLKLGNIDISMDTLRQLHGGYLLAAAAVHYSGFAVRGRRWQKLLAGMGHRVSYTYALTLLLSGWFVSALVPARLGDVARAYMLRRDHHIPMARGFASIATERALDIGAILALALTAAVWALAGRTPVWVWQSIGGAGILFAVGLLVLLAMPRLEGRPAGLWGWPPYQKTIRFGFDLLGSIRQLGRSPALLVWVVLQSVYIWLCDIFLMAFVFLSLGASVGLSVTAFVSMAVDLAAAVPIAPGAVGQFEGTALGLFSLFQIDPGVGGPVILLNRFISFWTFIIVSGIITYVFGFSQALQLGKSNELQLTHGE